MKFLADMNISLKTVYWLREQGYEIVHLREENLQRATLRGSYKSSIAKFAFDPQDKFIMNTQINNSNNLKTIPRVDIFYHIEDQQAVQFFLQQHPTTAEFLLRLADIVYDVYGEIHKSLTLWVSPVDGETHLRLTLDSNLEEDAEIVAKENQLFEILEQKHLLTGLDYVVISQCWKQV